MIVSNVVLIQRVFCMYTLLQNRDHIKLFYGIRPEYQLLESYIFVSEIQQNKEEHADKPEEDEEWEYVEEGPAEIIWQGNEIIVKKKRVRVAKGSARRQPIEEV